MKSMGPSLTWGQRPQSALVTHYGLGFVKEYEHQSLGLTAIDCASLDMFLNLSDLRELLYV